MNRIVLSITVLLMVPATGTLKLAASETVKGQTGTGSGMLADAVYRVVTSDSRLHWVGKKTGGEHNGTVDIPGGSFVVNQGNITSGELTIDMKSITVLDIKNESLNSRLVSHLNGEDFFNTDRHPEAYFKMKYGRFVEGPAGGSGHYVITGTLTIKDISNEIRFKAYLGDGNKLNIKTDEIVLDRTKWEVNFKSKTIFAQFADDYIHDEVYIRADLTVEQ